MVSLSTLDSTRRMRRMSRSCTPWPRLRERPSRPDSPSRGLRLLRELLDERVGSLSLPGSRRYGREGSALHLMLLFLVVSRVPGSIIACFTSFYLFREGPPLMHPRASRIAS